MAANAPRKKGLPKGDFKSSRLFFETGEARIAAMLSRLDEILNANFASQFSEPIKAKGK